MLTDLKDVKFPKRRSQTLNSRSFISMRAVIAPLPLADDIDEIHVPSSWSDLLANSDLADGLPELNVTPKPEE